MRLGCCCRAYGKGAAVITVGEGAEVTTRGVREAANDKDKNLYEASELFGQSTRKALICRIGEAESAGPRLVQHARAGIRKQFFQDQCVDIAALGPKDH